MEAEAAIIAGVFFLGLFVHGNAATVFFATAEVFPAAVFVSIAAIAMTAGMVLGILFFLTVTAVAKKATQQTADQAQLGVNNATWTPAKTRCFSRAEPVDPELICVWRGFPPYSATSERF